MLQTRHLFPAHLRNVWHNLEHVANVEFIYEALGIINSSVKSTYVLILKENSNLVLGLKFPGSFWILLDPLPG